MSRYTDDMATESWRSKGARFARYLATRKIECWGFFAAGIIVAKVIL